MTVTVAHGDFLETECGGLYDVIIADPPYNVRVLGKGLGDDMPLGDYVAWTQAWIAKAFRHLAPNGLMYVYGSPSRLAHIAVTVAPERQRWLVWHYKNKVAPGSRFWQRSHESILCLWRDERRPPLAIDRIREPYTEATRKQLGKTRSATRGRFGAKETVIRDNGGTLPRDVIEIPALSAGAGAKERRTLDKATGRLVTKAEEAQCVGPLVRHPTQKPLALCKKLIQSVIADEPRVLVPFAGSGSELVAAKQLGLTAFGTEIDADYTLLCAARLYAIGGAQ